MKDQNKLAKKLEQLKMPPPEAAWEAVAANLDGKKKRGAWFPMVAAAVLLGLLGISSMMFMESTTIKGISPELERQLLPQEQPILPTDVDHLDTRESIDEEQEEEAAFQFRQDGDKPSSTKQGRSETRSKLLAGSNSKTIDPFIDEVGSITPSEQNKQMPKARNINVKVSRVQPVIEEQPKQNKTKEFITNFDVNDLDPAKAFTQLKKIKNPENWNLPQIELRLPVLFDNQKPKTKEDEKLD